MTLADLNAAQQQLIVAQRRHIACLERALRNARADALLLATLVSDPELVYAFLNTQQDIQNLAETS